MAKRKANTPDTTSDRMAQFLATMDFKLLKDQKTAMYNMQVKIEKGKKLSQKDWDVLMGMIHFCDKVQDIAVDEYGYNKHKVYRLSRNS